MKEHHRATAGSVSIGMGHVRCMGVPPDRSRQNGEIDVADESTTTIWALFSTRDAAERAVERLVQEHGVDRADVFVQSTRPDNTSGSAPSGGNVASEPAEGSAFDPALKGAIEVSADVTAADARQVRQAFSSLGADEVRSG